MRGPLIIALLLVGSLAFGGETDGIHVAGVGEVVAVPDVARITLAVSQRSKDANVAKQAVDQVTGQVLDLARRLDIGTGDVTAAIIRLNPIYRRKAPDSQTIDAIEATRLITVRVKDLDKMGDLVNGALEVGINGIHGIQLDSSDRVELERLALDLAIADAKREADRVAQRFDVVLGALIDVRVHGHAAQPVIGAAMEMRSAAMPFNPGEMTIRRDVQATFAIADD